MRVALIHDWLTGMRGGERCLEVLCELYPDADIFTIVYDPGSVGSPIEDHRIYESFISRFPLAKTKYRHYLPLFPAAVEKFDLRSYDLVISSSHCAAKGVITRPQTFHMSYVHSPMRYVWDLYYDYFGKDQVAAMQRVAIAAFANYLRSWDVTSSVRIDYAVANSRFVARRIKKYWGKEAEVLHPPVSVDRFTSGMPKEDYDLIVSALVPYKRIDLAIDAYNELGRPLKIVGTGPEYAALKSRARNNIEFLGFADDTTVANLYARARTFVFPGEEDFGITPLEAMASGTPVVGYGSGGLLETVIDGETGILFAEQTPRALLDALKLAKEIDFNQDDLRVQAKRFDRLHFKDNIVKIINREYMHYMDSLSDL
jgi:glycosyltransferase involved in cell wall biosynthesis